MNKKANAYIWLATIATLIVVAIAYLTNTGVLNGFADATASQRASWTADQNQTWNQIFTSWLWWPALVIIGTLIWAIGRTISTDPYGGYR